MRTRVKSTKIEEIQDNFIKDGEHCTRIIRRTSDRNGKMLCGEIITIKGIK